VIYGRKKLPNHKTKTKMAVFGNLRMLILNKVIGIPKGTSLSGTTYFDAFRLQIQWLVA